MEVQKNMDQGKIVKPLVLDKKLENRFVDVSNLGPTPEGTRVLARKNCEHCFGTGVKGVKVGQPSKEPDWVKTTKNKRCPQHVERMKPVYQERIPIYCQCLRQYEKVI